MNKKILGSLIAISVLSLSGCFDDSTKTTSTNTETTSVEQQKSKREISTEKLNNFITNSSNITFGQSGDPIVIFFDPQCIHCHHLFNNTQDESLKDQKFIWIPLGYLNENSVAQAETLLASNDPQKALIEHEKQYGKDQFGIQPIKIIGENIKEKVNKNNELFKTTKLGGVPVLVKVNKNGDLEIAKGGLPVENIKEFINQ